MPMNTTSHNNEHPGDDQVVQEIAKSLRVLIKLNEDYKQSLLQAHPELSEDDQRFSEIDYQITQLKSALQDLTSSE
jgi:hypothetical protein